MWFRLDSIPPWACLLAGRTQPNQQLEQIVFICAVRQQAPKDPSSKWTIWSHTFTCFSSTAFSPSFSFIHDFTIFSVSVCGVQHLGNVFNLHKWWGGISSPHCSKLTQDLLCCRQYGASSTRGAVSVRWCQENPARVCALTRSTVMYCEHKTTQGKYANWFGTNQLFWNKAKPSSCHNTKATWVWIKEWTKTDHSSYLQDSGVMTLERTLLGGLSPRYC